MSKPKIKDDVTKKFLSGLEPAATQPNEIQQEDNTQIKRTNRPRIKSSGHAQRSYYISDEAYKKIKQLALDEDRDTSSIVREALDEYLSKR